jgi:hypothetical protein
LVGCDKSEDTSGLCVVFLGLLQSRWVVYRLTSQHETRMVFVLSIKRAVQILSAAESAGDDDGLPDLEALSLLPRILLDSSSSSHFTSIELMLSFCVCGFTCLGYRVLFNVDMSPCSRVRVQLYSILVCPVVSSPYLRLSSVHVW